MKRIGQLLCGAAIIMMTGTVASDVHARALFAYPLRPSFAYPLKGRRAGGVHDWRSRKAVLAMPSRRANRDRCQRIRICPAGR